MFRQCSKCGQMWTDRGAFLDDPLVRAIGYQADFKDLEAGCFLFNHEAPGCGTSFAVEVGAFSDLHDGPVFEERLGDTDQCLRYCMDDRALERCPRRCACAYVRDVLEKVAAWPKLDAAPVLLAGDGAGALRGPGTSACR